MIQLSDRIRALVVTGKAIKNIKEPEFNHIAEQARRDNPWFTAQSVHHALNGISHFLEHDKLVEWTSGLPDFPDTEKKIGTAMAGNIPLVGFHDFLAILISGHKIKAKLSSQDKFLMKYVANILMEIEPEFQEYIEFADFLKDVDAIIATGNDNTAKHFEYYFQNIPHIIRKNRIGVAVLDGKESNEELSALGSDVFTYFGLGCRSVAKLYIPPNFDLNRLFEAISDFEGVMDHHKYANNYDYNKSILLVNGEEFLDNGFLIIRQNENMASPISVLYYESYSSPEAVNSQLKAQEEKIQCVVSHADWVPFRVPFGKAQQPEPWDYADGVNTLAWLQSLNQ